MSSRSSGKGARSQNPGARRCWILISSQRHRRARRIIDPQIAQITQITLRVSYRPAKKHTAVQTAVLFDSSTGENLKT
jgi:hypothetical protein